VDGALAVGVSVRGEHCGGVSCGVAGEVGELVVELGEGVVDAVDVQCGESVDVVSGVDEDGDGASKVEEVNDGDHVRVKAVRLLNRDSVVLSRFERWFAFTASVERHRVVARTGAHDVDVSC
jgi:hypothetical protein